jgi:hypothetical protein
MNCKGCGRKRSHSNLCRNFQVGLKIILKKKSVGIVGVPAENRTLGAILRSVSLVRRWEITVKWNLKDVGFESGW